MNTASVSGWQPPLCPTALATADGDHPLILDIWCLVLTLFLRRVLDE